MTVMNFHKWRIYNFGRISDPCPSDNDVPAANLHIHLDSTLRIDAAAQKHSCRRRRQMSVEWQENLTEETKRGGRGPMSYFEILTRADYERSRVIVLQTDPTQQHLMGPTDSKQYLKQKLKRNFYYLIFYLLYPYL